MQWRNGSREIAQFKQKAEGGLEGREALMRDVSPTKRTFYQLELSHHGVSYFLSLLWARECLTARGIWAEKPLQHWGKGWTRWFLRSLLSLKVCYSTDSNWMFYWPSEYSNLTLREAENFIHQVFPVAVFWLMRILMYEPQLNHKT